MDNVNVVDFKRKAYEEMLAWKGTLAGKTALLSFVPRTLVKKGALHICHFTWHTAFESAGDPVKATHFGITGWNVEAAARLAKSAVELAKGRRGAAKWDFGADEIAAGGGVDVLSTGIAQ